MGKRKKTQTDKKAVQPRDKLLLVGFLSLIVLHIIGGFWHSYYSWGFSYWSLFSTNTIVFLGVLSIIALLATYYYRSKIKLDFVDRLQFTHKSKPVTFLFYTVISIVLFFILYNYRSQAHVYGDGYLILGNVLSLEDVFAASKSLMEIFTIYLYYFTVTTAKYLGIFSTANVLGALSTVAGVLGVWGLWSISKSLGSSKERRYFIFISALTSASIILFFGYIENYTWAMVSGLWTLYFSLGYVKRQNGILPLIFFSLISIGFHLIAFPFFLAGLYAVLLRSDKAEFIRKLHTLSLSLFFVLGTLIIVFIAQIKGISIFVPLWKIPENPYSMLSLEHMADILNQLIFVAPISIVMLGLILIQRKKRKSTIDDSSKVLYMVSFLTFLSAFFIDPQLGAVRDWDLLSLYGIPLTLYAGYSISNLYDKKKFPSWIIVASLIIVFVHIVPNIYEKNHPKSAVAYLDKVLWDDPHYQSDYQNAYRGLSWGFILRNNVGRNDLSEKYFTRKIRVDKYDPTPLYNLGVLHFQKNQIDSARYYLHKGFELTPQDPKFLSMLSEVENKSQNIQLAEKYAREALKLDSTYLPALTTLGIILSNQNKILEALFYFRKVYDVDPEDELNIMNLGIIYSRGINVDSAYYYMHKALPYLPESRKIEILGSLISITLYMNNKDEAIEYFNQLKKLSPNSEIVRKKEKEIYDK